MTEAEAKVEAIKTKMALPMLAGDVDVLIDKVNEICEMLHMNANAFGVIFFGHLLETMVLTAERSGCHVNLDGFLETTKQSIIHNLNNLTGSSDASEQEE